MDVFLTGDLKHVRKLREEATPAQVLKKQRRRRINRTVYAQQGERSPQHQACKVCKKTGHNARSHCKVRACLALDCQKHLPK